LGQWFVIGQPTIVEFNLVWSLQSLVLKFSALFPIGSAFDTTDAKMSMNMRSPQSGATPSQDDCSCGEKEQNDFCASSKGGDRWTPAMDVTHAYI